MIHIRCSLNRMLDILTKAKFISICLLLFFLCLVSHILESEKVEQSSDHNNSLSSEQVSLLLQKVFTKDRLKAILLQEEEEDKTKVQNLQQDLEGKDAYKISTIGMHYNYIWCSFVFKCYLTLTF